LQLQWLQLFFDDSVLNPHNAATFNLNVQERHDTDIFRHHGTLGWLCRSFTCGCFQLKKEFTMDDYQEELLEYQAFEWDPLDPADDATEL